MNVGENNIIPEHAFACICGYSFIYYVSFNYLFN
jgi:hypothetical protein